MPDGTISNVQFNQPAQTPPPTVPEKKGPGKFERFLLGMAGGAMNIVAPGSGSLISGLVGAGGGGELENMQSVLAQNQRSMTEMFTLQNQVQNQTQSFTLLTNIMKAKHDAEMSAVHNLKS